MPPIVITLPYKDVQWHSMTFNDIQCHSMPFNARQWHSMPYVVHLAHGVVRVEQRAILLKLGFGWSVREAPHKRNPGPSSTTYQVNKTCICHRSKTRRKKSRGRLKHARYSTTCYEYIKTWNNTDDLTFKEGLDCISALFLQRNQGVLYNNTLLCTRRHMKLYHMSYYCVYTVSYTHLTLPTTPYV